MPAQPGKLRRPNLGLPSTTTSVTFDKAQLDWVKEMARALNKTIGFVVYEAMLCYQVRIDANMEGAETKKVSDAARKAIAARAAQSATPPPPADEDIDL